MLLLLVLWVFVRERVSCLLWSFVYVLFGMHVFTCVGSVGFPGDGWFPVLTPAMSARNRKRRKLLRTLHAMVLQVLVCMFLGAYLFCLVGMFRVLFLTTNVCVDLGFIDGLPGELPADWTGFPAEVVDNLKGTAC